MDYIDLILATVLQKEYSAAVGFLNRYTSGTPLRVRVKLTALGLHHTAGYAAKDVFSGKLYGKFHPDDTFVADVNPTGGSFFQFVNNNIGFSIYTERSHWKH